MKIPTCNTCKKKLTLLTGVGWVHPPTPVNECTENDGMIIQNKFRELYNKTYGIPEYSFETIYSTLEKYKKENNLLKNEVTKWKKTLITQNNELKKENHELKALLQKKQLRNKLKKLWNGITNYENSSRKK